MMSYNALCVLILAVAHALQLQNEHPQLDVTNSLASKDQCAGTVGYIFVAQDGLPLQDVWRDYFDGCPQGSYTITMHSQNMARPTKLPEVELVQKPVQGKLRFKYRMQEVMNRGYEAALSRVAPNGCKPQYVHLLSESCAPMKTCNAFHAMLRNSSGTSFINELDGTRDDSPANHSRLPAAWMKSRKETLRAYHKIPKWFRKGSQWSTLWHEHAQFILDKEQENYPIWKHTFCPDEHYTINVLNQSGANITNRLITFPTYATNKFHEFIDDTFYAGHPADIECPADPSLLDINLKPLGFRVSHVKFAKTERRVSFRDLAQDTKSNGAFFARKFRQGCAKILKAHLKRMSLEKLEKPKPVSWLQSFF